MILNGELEIKRLRQLQILRIIFPYIIKFQNYETFNKYLESTYFLFLKDKVSFIRETGISKIKVKLKFLLIKDFNKKF